MKPTSGSLRHQVLIPEDAAKTQYFARMQGPEGSRSAIVKKTDLEKGAADEVTTALVAKLRGQPITEGKKLAGSEFKLSHSSHSMRINEFRHGVNVGARIEQSRVGFNLARQGREKLTEYIKELYEEVICMAASGARGTQRGLQLVRQGSGADFSFTQDKLTLDVHPLRGRGDSIEVDMALAPSFNASSIETDVASPYVQEIAQGALATLQMMPGVAWSDPGLAGINKAVFSQRVATVAMHIARGQGAARVVSSRTYC